jgi:non-canonical poly(A) RNA polymerase PAPD5/7
MQTSQKARLSSINRRLATACHHCGPPMHSIRSRPICRAHNSFSPSVALWQHFIAPNQHLLQRQPRSSFTTEATKSHVDESPESSEGIGAVKLDNASTQDVPKPLKIKRLKTDAGDFVPNRALFPRFREIDEQRQNKLKGQQLGPRQNAEKLLALAKEAFESAEDYTGVTVQPIDSRVPVRESHLPWSIRNREAIKSGEDR